jgi:hypothetical protein
MAGNETPRLNQGWMWFGLADALQVFNSLPPIKRGRVGVELIALRWRKTEFDDSTNLKIELTASGAVLWKISRSLIVLGTGCSLVGHPPLRLNL